jgi:hypothetical protein
MDIVKALVLAGFDNVGQWKLSGNTYSGLEWRDDTITKPTEAELQAAYNAGKYVYERQYPAINDQLDLLWHDINDGKISTAAKSSSWFLAVKAVKDANPKP